MTTKLTPHPLADIFRAVADGRTVQYCTSIKWIDYEAGAYGPPPLAYIAHAWRIKPETVRYRLYLRVTESGVKMSCTTDEKYNVQDLDNFIKWHGDWKEEEI